MLCNVQAHIFDRQWCMLQSELRQARHAAGLSESFSALLLRCTSWWLQDLPDLCAALTLPS
jgi:hypothetical protein